MEDDFEMATGVPPGTNLNPIAEGEREFKTDPSQFMKFIDDVAINHAQKFTSGKTSVNENIGDQSANKNAMKNLLEKLPDVHDSATYAIEKSLRDPATRTEVTKAILTESNVGKEWQIRINESFNGKTLYSVVNSNARKSYYKDLYLQGAAKKLCQLLESNIPLNSSSINKVLYYDEVYRKNYDEAMSFKKHYKSAMRKGDRNRAGIYESKFESARTKALEAKTNIKKIR